MRSTPYFVDFNYIAPGKHAKSTAKETLGYNEARPGKDDQEIIRQLFGNGGPMTREQAEWLIDNASKNTYFFRMILSPPPNDKNPFDLDLWEITKDAIAWLEERLNRVGEIQFIGAEHENTNVQHLHAILLMERRGREKILNPADIAAFKEQVRELVLEQRRGREIVQERGQMVSRVGDYQRDPPMPSPIVLKPAKRVGRLHCLVCDDRWQELVDQGLQQCPGCGRDLGRRREAPLALSR